MAAAGEVDVSGLRSQYLNTTITNDAGATMEAVFVADTKAYIDVLEEKINDKQDTPETEGAEDNNAYPAYFDENIKAAVEKIKDNMAEVGQNGETFVFITDIHWDASERNSPALVNYIYDKTNVQTLICGGDLINEGEHDTMRDDILDVVHQFGSAEHPFITLFGNHDSNKNYTNADMPERWFSENGIYSYMFKQAEKHVTFWNGFNFCVDNPATKTRFVCLNTKENGSFAEYSDLTDILVGTPSGYHVVIVAHWLYNKSVKSESCVNLEQIIDAYNARSSVTISGVQPDYTNAQADIVYMQGGHCHRDISWTTPNGVPVVLTDCDVGRRTNNEEYPYVKGTITEHCFDIITMNYTDKSIKMVRVGGGDDRAFTQA